MRTKVKIFVDILVNIRQKTMPIAPPPGPPPIDVVMRTKIKVQSPSPSTLPAPPAKWFTRKSIFSELASGVNKH